MHTFVGDLRYGARLLRRTPGFTFVAVAALAIGIGANLTIFGFASELLLSPPRGIAAPAQVVRAFTNRFSGTAFPAYEAYRDRNHTFVALAAFRGESVSLRQEAGPEQLFGVGVSGNYFAALGVPAAAGRTIGVDDDRPGAAPVVMLTDRFWRRRFNGSHDVFGQTLVLNGRAATIVGVSPAAFAGTMAPLAADVWTPLTQSPRAAVNSVQMIGRLRDGVSIREAQADLTTLAAQIASAAPARTERPLVTVYQARTLMPEMAIPAAIFAALLLGVVGLVLLLACVNIANLLLARSAVRAREIGVRIALGAGRGRLVRQMLTESLLLSSAGAVGAGVLALVAARPIAAAVAALPSPVPLALNFVVDWRVAAAALGLLLATTAAFGLVPALQASKRDVLPALKDGVATAGRDRSRLRGIFMTSQVALSTLLLVISALLIRGLLSAHRVDRGLVVDSVMTATVDLSSAGYTAERGQAFYERLRAELEQAPGVAAANIVDIVPLALSNRASPLVKEDGTASSDSPHTLVYQNAVSPGHFRTLGIRLTAGRDFDPGDRSGTVPVAIVNEALARAFWPGESPIGRRMRARTGRDTFGPWLEVVGVARDSKYVTVGEDRRLFMYQPLAQAYSAGGTILVKSRGRAADAVPVLRAAIAAIDPDLAVFNVMTLDAATSISLLPLKVAATLAGGLGLLALALGAIGLYGVMSYLVRQRTREIGIRMALGARPAAVVALITRCGMRWTVIGLAVGAALAFAVAKLISGFLYGVGPADPVAFVGITLLLAATALIACYVPARRASRVDPLEALHEE